MEGVIVHWKIKLVVRKRWVKREREGERERDRQTEMWRLENFVGVRVYMCMSLCTQMCIRDRPKRVNVFLNL